MATRRRKGFFSFMVPEGESAVAEETTWWQGGRSRKLRDDIFKLKHEADRVNRKLEEATNFQN